MRARPPIEALQRFDAGIGFPREMTAAALAAVPGRRGVMLLLADGGRLIVLMTAANLRSRLLARLKDPSDDSHGRLPDLGRITRQILWTLTRDTFETDLAYLEHAAAVYPRAYGRLVAWKPPWLVRVDLSDRFPHPVRAGGAAGSAGQQIGPFATGKSADRYIALLQDVFDLCRRPECGRLALRPRDEIEGGGTDCPYAQMKKCPAVCDGTTSLADYARRVSEAVAIAQGPPAARKAMRERLTREMQAAAADLQFERAAALKTKCEHLAELDGREFAGALPLEAFTFLVLQRGRGTRRINVFLVDRGAIVRGEALDWPLRDEQLASALDAMAAHAGHGADIDELGDYRMGLVCRMLMGNDQQRRRLVRWHDAMTVSQLRAEIESAAAVLRLARAD